MCRPQIGTDAHRLGRYGIPVIPTPTTEQTTNTGSANRRRLRHSCRRHSNMTYSSSQQLAMPTKTISHRTRRTHRKAGCETAHRTHSCCGGGRRPPLLTKRTQTFANSEFGEKHALTFCVDPILWDYIPSKRFCEFREFRGTTSQARVSSVGATGRGCSCLSGTNKADRHIRSVDALLTRLVHLLFGWCT